MDVFSEVHSSCSFLQDVRIARNAERCNSQRNSVRHIPSQSSVLLVETYCITVTIIRSKSVLLW